MPEAAIDQALAMQAKMMKPWFTALMSTLGQRLLRAYSVTDRLPFHNEKGQSSP